MTCALQRKSKEFFMVKVWVCENPGFFYVYMSKRFRKSVNFTQRFYRFYEKT